jgi:hypothetical protein
VALLYPALAWGGIVGVSVLFTLTILAGVVLAVSLAAKAVGSSTGRAFSGTIYPVTIALVSAAAAALVASVAFDGESLNALIAGSLVFALSYFGLMAALRRQVLVDIFGIFRSAFSSETD